MPNDCHYWKSFYVGQCLYNKYPHPLSVRLSSLSTLTSSDLSKNTLFFTMVHPLEAWNLIRSHQLFFFFFFCFAETDSKVCRRGRRNCMGDEEGESTLLSFSYIYVFLQNKLSRFSSVENRVDQFIPIGSSSRFSSMSRGPLVLIIQ